MGGCQGCHGQAQQGGTDFSFLLDNAGKPVVTPDIYQTYEEALKTAQTPPPHKKVSASNVKKVKAYVNTLN